MCCINEKLMKQPPKMITPRMISSLIIICLSTVCPLWAQPCEWPDYFDLSSRAAKQRSERRNDILTIYDNIQTSWRTDMRVRKKNLVVNGGIEKLTLVDVMNKTSIEISDVQEGSVKLATNTYLCKKKINDNVILLEKTKTRNISDFSQKLTTTFRCLQLRKHSEYVLQWNIGPESVTEPNCNKPFGELSDWPLVYWPITVSFSIKDREPNSDLLEKYPSCPMSGGYLMQGYNGDGTEISCQNKLPSYRFEMECTKGEGLYLTPGHLDEKCDTSKFAFNKKAGSKFYCLGSWTDSKYRFTVLVPDRHFSINSFHCLRTNKDDPTTEPAILFLDNVCRTSVKDLDTESFLRISLRRKNIDSFCDDYSDQCARSLINCDNPTQSTTCFKTCNNCPDISTKETEPEIRGKWILQKVSEHQTVNIDTKEITFPGLGTFDINGVSNATVCRGNSFTPDKANETVYILSKLANAEGCVPRIMSLSIKEIDKGVAVLFYTPPNPLRNQPEALTTNHWCQIIKQNIDYFSYLYNPYWPPMKSPYTFTNGWYIAVNPSRQQAAKCGLDEIMFDQKFDVTFDSTQAQCKGDMKKGDGGDTWVLSYDECSPGKAASSLTFTCLTGVHQLGWTYRFSIMQSSDSASDSAEEIQPGGYYCLIFPRHEYLTETGSIFDYPLLINHASRCDSHFQRGAGNDIRFAQKTLPLIRLDISEASYAYASQLLLLSTLFFSLILNLGAPEYFWCT